jgi:hypothetical protein
MQHGNQTKLARIIGYKQPSAISLIYSGLRRPSPRFAKLLAKETKTDIGFWLDMDTPVKEIQNVLDRWNL